MQLHCSVLINSFTLLTSEKRQRYSRGILSLRHGKISKIGECQLVIITPRNRNGRLFNITRGNVRRIHSAKMQWGSVTIEMNSPSVLICIKEASVSSLHNFISKLQKVLANEEVILDGNVKVTSTSFALLRKRLIMATRKQYNENKLGFPHYLLELIMSKIGLTAVDSRWFGATSLRVLDLSGNKLGASDSFEIKFLNIVRLQHLKVLVLADNEIQCISDDLWNALPQNLLSLDLSNNHISYLSPCCMRFPQMTRLWLRHNRIEELPRTINTLKKLKCLDISWNKLKFLPSEIKNLSLEMIDVTAYNSDEKLEVQNILNQLLQTVSPIVKVGTLFEYAAATVLNYRISTNSIPELLRVMMEQAVKNCKSKSGESYRFYPASIVTAKYHIEDVRSLAFQAVSRTNYYVILQDLEVI
ncbi:leucine Rich Repeat family protein [Loa loa]|uniref:Leucine Rich Repeat family protein n=1 Tax=Loa loa TaxID=7209 RepID=A0A1I7VL81_LOALO|nr:leucine Rich Repeat family protein [Loa loa]EFO21330.2 leucine Rich Repeat family protein [Loa loa]